MNCIKCGSHLNEGDLFCTHCGSSVSLDTNLENNSTKVLPLENNAIDSKWEDTPKKKNTSVVVGVSIFVILIVVGVITWFILNSMINGVSVKKVEPSNDSNIPTDNSKKPKKSDNYSKDDVLKIVSFEGYKFFLETDFAYDEHDSYGFILRNEQVAFSVKFDYTNTFEDYEKLAIDSFGEETAENGKEVIHDRDYLFYYMKSPTTDAYLYIYVTETNDHDVAFGLFSLIDGSMPDINDVSVIDTIIDRLIITANYDENQTDYGVDGAKFPEFDFDFYTYN